MTEAFINCVHKLLTQWKLQSAPFIISEDGTALEARLSVRVLNDHQYDTVQVFGLCGGSYLVRMSKGIVHMMVMVGSGISCMYNDRCMHNDRLDMCMYNDKCMYNDRCIAMIPVDATTCL